MKDKSSILVLKECVELQLKKSADYQADESDVTQAMYYPRGIDSLYDMLNTKMLRIKSLLDKARKGGDQPNHESIEDSLKDLINYSSFSVSWLRQEMEGQDSSRNMFNEKISKKEVLREVNSDRE